MKGQDVPSGGRLADEQPGRSRGAAVSRSGLSAQITRRPLPPLAADCFARATSRERTSKLSMIDGVEPATKVSTKGPRVSRSSLFLISSARCFENGLHSTSIAPRSMDSKPWPSTIEKRPLHALLFEKRFDQSLRQCILDPAEESRNPPPTTLMRTRLHAHASVRCTS